VLAGTNIYSLGILVYSIYIQDIHHTRLTDEEYDIDRILCRCAGSNAAGPVVLATTMLGHVYHIDSFSIDSDTRMASFLKMRMV
jgi:hypothetical protein